MTNHVIIRLKNNFRENLEIHRILFLIFQKSMKAIKFFILLKKFLAYLNIFQIYSTQKKRSLKRRNFVPRIRLILSR